MSIVYTIIPCTTVLTSSVLPAIVRHFPFYPTNLAQTLSKVDIKYIDFSIPLKFGHQDN